MKFAEVPEKSRRYVKEGIRKAFRFSYLYDRALDSARVEMPRYKKDGNLSKIPDVFYRCAKCDALWKKKNREVQIDHIIPVVPIQSSELEMTISEYCYRVFNNPLQVMCKYCHLEKTNEENNARKEYKKSSCKKPKGVL